MYDVTEFVCDFVKAKDVLAQDTAFTNMTDIRVNRK